MDIYNEMRLCVSEIQEQQAKVIACKEELSSNKDSQHLQRYLVIAEGTLIVTKESLKELVNAL